jgi:hypothetical protein
MKRNLALIATAALALSSATAATSPDLAALAAAVQSNIVAKIEAATAVRKSAVRELLTTNSYKILTSTKLSDAVAKLALQKQLADAALEDFLSTEDGRFRCHGRYVGQTVDLASQTATFTHADGTEYTVKFAAPNLTASVAAANKRLPAAPLTNGIPAKLVAARLRRYQEIVDSPSNVTLRVTATTAAAPTAETIAALAAENAAKAAALEKAAEEARLFAETNVVEEVEAPIIEEGDITK